MGIVANSFDAFVDSTTRLLGPRFQSACGEHREEASEELFFLRLSPTL